MMKDGYITVGDALGALAETILAPILFVAALIYQGLRRG